VTITMNDKTLSLLLGGLLGGLLCGACTHAPGPRPVLSGLRVSAVGAEGTSTLRGRIQVDFRKIADKRPDEKVEYLLQAVTLTAESLDGLRSDRLAPAVVVGTVATPVLKADYPARVAFDFVLFPARFAGSTLRLRAKNVYERSEGDPSYVDLQVAPVEAMHTEPAKAEEVRLHPPKGGRQHIEVLLDRDAPAVMEGWHVVDGKAYRMDRKGSRVWEREFAATEAEDHLVFLDAGGAWLSAPYPPSEDGDEDDE